MSDEPPIAVRSGPWQADAVCRFLDDSTIPVRLASAGRHFPMVQSLWYLHEDGALWCCTQSESVLAQRLQADRRCGFEVAADAPPYRGVRGTGHATILPEAASSVLPRLIARYLGSQPSPLGEWLLSRLATEVAIRIDGLMVTSWDYSARM